MVCATSPASQQAGLVCLGTCPSFTKGPCIEICTTGGTSKNRSVRRQAAVDGSPTFTVVGGQEDTTVSPGEEICADDGKTIDSIAIG